MLLTGDGGVGGARVMELTRYIEKILGNRYFSKGPLWIKAKIPKAQVFTRKIIMPLTNVGFLFVCFLLLLLLFCFCFVYRESITNIKC